MAEEEEIEVSQQAEAEPEIPKAPRKPSKMLKMLINVISVIVLIVILIYLARYIFSSKTEQKKNRKEQITQEKKHIKKEPLKTLKLKPFRFNLKNKEGQYTAFLQLEIVLAYDKTAEKLALELPARETQFQDLIRSMFSKKTRENVDTPAKMKLIKQELKNRINALLINGKIKEIYFLDFNLVTRN